MVIFPSDVLFGVWGGVGGFFCFFFLLLLGFFLLNIAE